MNLREIKDLIQLMNENSLCEIEVEHEGTKIKLKKTGSEVIIERPLMQASMAHAQGPAAPVKEAEAPKGRPISSPMVGTFYAAPAPDAEPYVKAGSRVEIGQVVCIIEAMKLMNEIKSEVAGTVAEVLATNGEPVEFGQVLFTVS